MACEKFPCGCEVTFRSDGQVGGVCCCEAHASIFSEHKSLKQLSLDVHHQQLVEKHAPPKPPEPPEPPK